MPLQYECRNGCFSTEPFDCSHGGSKTGGTTVVRASVEAVVPLAPGVIRERLRVASALGQDRLWAMLETIHREQPIEDAGLHRVELRVPVPDRLRWGWIPEIAREVERAVNTV